MGYAFDPHEKTPATALRRIATEELDAALARLADPGLDEARKVHELRKQVKKLRGLLRLARPNMPAFATENAALRDAARGISGLRDAEVMRQTLARMSDRVAQGNDPALNLALSHLGRALESHHHDARSSLAAAGLAAFGTQLAAVRARVPDWGLRGRGFDLLAPGLALTWRKARKGHRRASLPGAHPEAFHDWRKAVKDHWYQARLLTPIWPAIMVPHVAAAEDLGTTLGLHHDLAVLQAHLPRTGLSNADRARIDALIASRTARLEARSLTIAARLLAGDDKALVDRWGTWWDASRIRDTGAR